MNKYVLRAFSGGVFFTALFLLLAYWSLEDEPNQKMDLTTASAFVEEQGYLVLTKDELDEHIEKNEENKAQSEASPTADTLSKVEIKIEPGMLPQEVAAQLEEQAVIEHSEDFTSFLEEFDYSQKLRVGTYEVTQQMTYKELAETFSKIKRNEP